MGAITYDIEIPSSRCSRPWCSTETPSFQRSCHRPSRMSKSWKETVASQYKSVKHRAEGDALSGVIESITYHIKIVPTEDGGSICKNRSIYNTKGDVEITEDKIKEGKEKAMAMFKAID